MSRANPQHKTILLVITILAFSISASAIDLEVENNNVSDVWTEEEIENNPILLNFNFEEDEQLHDIEIHNEQLDLTSVREENGTIDVEADIEEGQEAGEYEKEYVIETSHSNGEDRNASGTFTVIVEERFEGSIDFDLKSENINITEQGLLATIEIENAGNLEDTAEINWDEEWITGDEELTTQKGETETLDLFYNTGEDTEVGEKTPEINVTSQISNETFQPTINLQDELPPEILNIEVLDVQGTLTTPIDVELDSYSPIETVEGIVTTEIVEEVQQGNETVEQTSIETVEEFDFSQVEEGHWTYDFEETENIGEHTLEVSAQDTSGNIVTETTTFQVTELDIIESDFDIFPELAQRNAESTAEAFRITEDGIDVTLELDTFDYEQRVNQVDIELVTPTGATRNFEELGDTVTINQEGQYLIQVTGGRTGEYQAMFNFQPPEQHKDLDQLNVEGEFVDIVIPPDTERNWQGAEYLSCEVTNLDQSNIEDARYTCEIPFYLDSFEDVDEQLIPVQPSTYDDEITSLQSDVETLESDLNSSQFWHYMKNGFIGFLVVLFGMLVTIYPRAMMFFR